MDVVVVTLGRTSLEPVIHRALTVLPNPKFFFVTKKGVIGTLRNEGLSLCSSDLVCFLDDDVLLNKNWLRKCLVALGNPDVHAVVGRLREAYTVGCMIVKRLHYPHGVFTPLESFKTKTGIVYLEDAVCDHINARNLALLHHSLHWLFHGVGGGNGFGMYHHPKYVITQFLQSLQRGLPDYVMNEVFWLGKSVCVWPFLLKKIEG